MIMIMIIAKMSRCSRLLVHATMCALLSWRTEVVAVGTTARRASVIREGLGPSADVKCYARSYRRRGKKERH